MRNGKLPNMLLYTKPKQEKNPDGTSLVGSDEYEIQVMEWKEKANIQIKRKRNVNEGNQSSTPSSPINHHWRYTPS